MRDKSHMQAIERWAEFVKNNPRSMWKSAVNALVDAQYEKADAFYAMLEKTPEGMEILERLKMERLKTKEKRV